MCFGYKLILAVAMSILQRSWPCWTWTIPFRGSRNHHPSLSLSHTSLTRSSYFHNALSSTSCASSITTVLDTNTNHALSNDQESKNKDFRREDYPDNIILFDGICNFCNTWVDLLLRLDSQKKKFVFAPLQSNIGKNLLISIEKDADDISSVLLIKKNDINGVALYYDKSDCVLQVVQELGPLGKVFSRLSLLVVPIGVRNEIYDMVAENRYNFLGKRDECRYGDPKYFDRFIS